MHRPSLITLFALVVFGAGPLYAQVGTPDRTITSEGFRSQRPVASEAAGSGRKAAIGASSATKKNADVLSSPKRKYSFVNRVAVPNQAVSVVIKPAAAPSYKSTPPQGKTASPVLKSEELGLTF